MIIHSTRLSVPAIFRGGLALILAACFIASVDAGNVRVETSSEETYVGMPVSVSVTMFNYSDHEPPELEPVDGLRIESGGPPDVSSSTIINGNGKRTDTNIHMYRFSVTPLRPGDFVIPPIQVKGDGKTAMTRAIRIHADESETGDLMFAAVTTDQSVCYVGQPLRLKLTIDVLPYRDQEFKVQLQLKDHWRQFSNIGHWGVFTEALERMRHRREEPHAEKVQRPNASGETKTYFRYHIEASMYPDRPGPIPIDDLRIVARYPKKLERVRNPFGGSLMDDFFGRGASPFASRLTISKVKPLVVKPDVPDLRVLPIPLENAPTDYRGAVGRYTVAVAAAPVDVEVGEPIDLQIVIQGEVANSETMNLVQPPPLPQIESLTANFKISKDPLGGLVQGENKLFQTTLRPRAISVTEIPKIPFTFFDPEKAAFETVYSDPVKIHVQESDVLRLGTSARGDRSGLRFDNQPTDDSEKATSESSGFPRGLSAAEVSAIAMLRKHGLPSEPVSPHRFSWTRVWFWILAIPVASLLVWIVSQFRDSFSLGGVDRIARQIDRADSVAEVGQWVRVHLQRLMPMERPKDSYSEPRSFDALVGEMRVRGLSPLANQCERVLGACQTRGGSSSDLVSIKQQAQELIRAIEPHRRELKRPRNQTGHRLAMATKVLLLVALFPASITASESTDGRLLDESTRQRLLNDVLGKIEDAYSDPGKREHKVPEILNHEILNQLQTLAASGAVNAELFMLMARCKVELGQPAEAIADYLAALQMQPDNTDVRQAIAEITQQWTPPRRYFLLPNAVVQWTVWANSITWATLAILFWGIAWATLTLKWIGKTRRFKLVFLVGTLLGGASMMVWIDRQLPLRWDSHAVVTKDSVDLRSGSGADCSVVVPMAAHQGDVVRVIRRRGDWVQVEIDDETRGWEARNKFAPIGRHF